MTRRPFTAFCLAFPIAALVACASSSSSSSESSHDAALQQFTDRQIVRAAFDNWTAGTGSPYDILAPDATWTITGSSPRSRTYHGKQQFLDEVINPFNARMSSPLVPTLQSIDSEGDTVIVRFFGSAIARDGKPYNNTYLWRLTMRNEMIVSAVATFDTRQFDELWTRVQPAP